jgi:hypothetical protein
MREQGMFRAAILAAASLVAFIGCHHPTQPVLEEPYVVIESLPAQESSDQPIRLHLPHRISWHSGTKTTPTDTRWLLALNEDTTGHYDPSFDILRDLETHPSRYESKWTQWFPYTSDEGRTNAAPYAIPGGDTGRVYLFAVQARDRGGRVTTHFSGRTNARRLTLSWAPPPTYVPILTIVEPLLGTMRFDGTDTTIVARAIAPGTTLNFTWHADASAYGGAIIYYRYGWDVEDVNDPNDWDVLASPFNVSVSTTLYSGTHTFFVDTGDNSGGVTLGRIEISVIP